MNKIDIFKAQLEQMIGGARAVGHTEQLRVLVEALSRLEKECVDLLGRPLMDPRRDENVPHNSRNCALNTIADEKTSGFWICKKTGKRCYVKPADCPVDWSVEP